uniref:Uncharacterized protein n=1 Tax=Chromera velia CCMP2878 TaxID=1169474 RepID=A0A0G4GM06_9ALVE|eukprot:Cvel_22485.t1-p1 / transcript=Cvel_22485.t1 / gene=Cvel_22485 / organism=Chromera_velia_CCMP2878 / gene_product=hypothetical protein / transcript_product=hypothetical protein / location=Cvel_scaffold2214:30959-31379(+) / protein_length=102 / sequence_SO=supercontig / SO=protein_coding / is_pseudo=false
MTSLPEEVEAEVEVLKFTYEDILSWKDDDPESRCMFLELRPRTGMAAAHQFLQVTVQVDFSQADQSDQIEDAVSFRITRLRGFEDDRWVAQSKKKRKSFRAC